MDGESLPFRSIPSTPGRSSACLGFMERAALVLERECARFRLERFPKPRAFCLRTSADVNPFASLSRTSFAEASAEARSRRPDSELQTEKWKVETVQGFSGQGSPFPIPVTEQSGDASRCAMTVWGRALAVSPPSAAAGGDATKRSATT